MKNERKNILIIAGTSDIAIGLIEKLIQDDFNVFITHRRKNYTPDFIDKVNSFYLDITNESQIDNFFAELIDIKFDFVVNFQGIAISSPVEFLKSSELRRQLDVSLFSLLSVLRNLKNRVKNSGKIIYVSSMASFGVFPFISPYCIAKSSADILLSAYEIETGIKTISIKPGVIRTKFWDSSITENKENFENFPSEYEEIGKFLVKNAKNNSNRGLYPKQVSDLIYKVINLKNPKHSYLIGKDAYFTAFISNFKSRTLFKLINLFLNFRTKRSKNET